MGAAGIFEAMLGPRRHVEFYPDAKEFLIWLLNRKN